MSRPRPTGGGAEPGDTDGDAPPGEWNRTVAAKRRDFSKSGRWLACRLRQPPSGCTQSVGSCCLAQGFDHAAQARRAQTAEMRGAVVPVELPCFLQVQCHSPVWALQVQPQLKGLPHVQHLPRPGDDRDSRRVEAVRARTRCRPDNDVFEARRDPCPPTFDVLLRVGVDLMPRQRRLIDRLLRRGDALL